MKMPRLVSSHHQGDSLAPTVSGQNISPSGYRDNADQQINGQRVVDIMFPDVPHGGLSQTLHRYYNNMGTIVDVNPYIQNPVTQDYKVPLILSNGPYDQVCDATISNAGHYISDTCVGPSTSGVSTPHTFSGSSTVRP